MELSDSEKGGSTQTMSALPDPRSNTELSVVTEALGTTEDARKALVVGPFPPLIGQASYHASSILHLFKEAGFKVRSATGPGLAFAGHNLSFVSETQLKRSMEFLSGASGYDFSVIYAKSLDFSKVSKPKWYKRRLEELRRLRVLVRLINNSKNTMLVLESRPYFSRYQISLWLTARVLGGLLRKRVYVAKQSEKVAYVFEQLTSLKMKAPTAYDAEETAYDAAFQDHDRSQPILLSVARVEQALNFWIGREKRRENSATAQDIRDLIEVVRRHEMDRLPHFRLLWSTTSDQPDWKPRGSQRARYLEANSLLSSKVTFGVPITRYMQHLWTAVGPNRRFRLKSRRDAENVLKWYISEAPSKVPAKSVPFAKEVRDHFLRGSRKVNFGKINTAADIVPALGRDVRPFGLSPPLSRLASEEAGLSGTYDVNDPADRLGFVLERLLQYPSASDAISYFGSSTTSYLAAPIGGDKRNVSRLELLLAIYGKCPLKGREEAELPWQAGSIGRFINQNCLNVFPAIKGLVKKSTQSQKPRKQLVVSGLPKSETGVGSNLHMSVSAFEAIGLSPAILDSADKMRPVQNQKRRKAKQRLKRSIALHHVNADMIPQSVLAPPMNGLIDPIQLGFLLWEFDVLPQSHMLALDLLDEIWTPSSFLQRIYQKHCDKPVLNMMKGLYFPKVPDFDMAEFGFKTKPTVFLVSFDFHSSVARKNPLAAVEAFSKAFPKNNREVALIVKTTPAVSSHWGDPENQMRKIHQIAARDSRIKVVAEYFPFNKLLSLIKGCDCLVSSHRAEGFGLIPAYALGLGKMVITTDYSGTTDFCSETTAFPIPYAKVAVEPRQILHPVKGATWAEIEKNALIETMRDVIDKPQEGVRRAKEGKVLIREKYSVQKQSERYFERLLELGVL